MSTLTRAQLATSLAQFSSLTRLYALHVDDAEGELRAADMLVVAFLATDAVNQIGSRDVIALSINADIEPAQLLGKMARLDSSLADRTRTGFHGTITEVAMLGSDGGFTRYRQRLSPWLWRLSQAANSRVWQEKSVIEIVDAVFAAYLPCAAWRWSGEARRCMNDAVARSYCCQYRESDLDFVSRLLAEEGLNYRFEHSVWGPELVLFADSRDRLSVPEGLGSVSGAAIRYHGDSAVEAQDSVQAIMAQRCLSLAHHAAEL